MTSFNLFAVACAFFRLSPLILVVPGFPFAFLPVLVRLVLTVVLASIIALSSPVVVSEFDVGVLAGEFCLGLCLSLGFHAASAAIHMMSQLIDIQTGLAVAQTFDPTNYQPNSTLSALFSMVLVICFFSLNVHYDFLLAFSELFRVAPPGTSFSIGGNFFHAISAMFLGGFVVASPVIITLWLMDIGLALVSRALPQAQIYFVALPLKVFLALLLLGIMLGHADYSIYAFLKNILQTWMQLIKN